MSTGSGIEPGQPWVDDGSTLYPPENRDLDWSDETPHATLRDADTDTAYQLHVEDAASDPWRGLTLWQGTQTASGSTFTVGTARPSLRVDESGNLFFNHLQSVGAQRCINLDANGQLSLASAACGTGGGGNSFETISVPAGTNPVADSATDTLTITETSPLVITGTAGTDTIDITFAAGGITATELGTDSVSADELDAAGVEAELETALDIDGEVSSAGMASTVLDETGISLTSITIGALLGVDSIDATGAVDMDYGSADITDHTFVSDGGTVIVDGSVTAPGGATLGTTNTVAVSSAGVVTFAGTAQPYVTITLTSASAVPASASSPQFVVLDGTNVDKYVLLYDGTAAESAQWSFPVPENITGTTCNAYVYWSIATCTGASADTVHWDVSSNGVANNEDYDAAFGSAGGVDDTCGTANYIYVSDAISFTHGWAGNDEATVKVARDPTDAQDNGGENRLHQVRLQCDISQLSYQ